MRIGLGFLGERLEVSEKIKFAKMAEKYGLDSVWIAEHYYFRDATITSSAILAHTKRIKVGTSIINPYTRHPAVIAMAAATLDEQAPGRFLLGIGSGFPGWIEDQMGIPMGSQVGSLSEAVRIIRSVLSGENTLFEGERFKVRDVKMEFNRGGGRVPIYVAAVGPRMLRTACKVGDGVMLSSGSSFSYIRSALSLIRGAQREFGKTRTRSVCLSILSLSRNQKKARDAARPWLVMPLLRPGRAKLVLGDESRVKESAAALAAGNLRKAAKLLPDDVVDEISITGDFDECIEKVHRHVKLGVSELVLEPVFFESKDLEVLFGRVAS